MKPDLKCKRTRIIFPQDNAASHKDTLAIKQLRHLKYEMLKISPRLPDLTPSDFYLFPDQTKFLARTRFGSKENLILAVDGWIFCRPSKVLPHGHKLPRSIFELKNTKVPYKAEYLTSPPRNQVGVLHQLVLELFYLHYLFEIILFTYYKY